MQRRRQGSPSRRLPLLLAQLCVTVLPWGLGFDWFPLPFALFLSFGLYGTFIFSSRCMSLSFFSLLSLHLHDYNFSFFFSLYIFLFLLFSLSHHIPFLPPSSSYLSLFSSLPPFFFLPLASLLILSPDSLCFPPFSRPLDLSFSHSSCRRPPSITHPPCTCKSQATPNEDERLTGDHGVAKLAVDAMWYYLNDKDDMQLVTR